MGHKLTQWWKQEDKLIMDTIVVMTSTREKQMYKYKSALIYKTNNELPRLKYRHKENKKLKIHNGRKQKKTKKWNEIQVLDA